MNRRGFTLLEVLVATVIMGIAVVGLLSGISQSLRNATRVTDYDRAAVLARSKMDELIVDDQAPWFSELGGAFDPVSLGGREGGWRARITPSEVPPGPYPGADILLRIQLEIWWKQGNDRRTFALEGYRIAMLRPQDMAAISAGAR